jgi:hypothetical protein
MKIVWKYILLSSLLWIGFIPLSKAQPGKFLPSTVRVGTDLVAIGYSFASRDQIRFEFNADADVHKYFGALDYGFASTRRSDNSNTFVYQNNGHYVRVGADINLLPQDEFGNVIFVGLRYGRSIFSDDLTFSQAQNPYYAPINSIDIPGGLTNRNLQMGWGEVVAGVKIQLVKQLYIGFTGRIKFGSTIGGVDDLIPFEVPGYGTYAKKNVFGLNYVVYYRFRLRDKPLIPKLKKKPETPETE